MKTDALWCTDHTAPWGSKVPVIRFLARLFWPFGRGSERRRERSKRKSTRKGTLPEHGQRTARTTDGERSHMFDLYEQGLGTHAIANKRGRSTHTPTTPKFSSRITTVGVAPRSSGVR